MRFVPLILAVLLLFSSVPGAAAQTAADPKTLVVGTSFDAKSLDPARGFETTTGMIHKATYNTLVTLSDSDISQIVPDLATSWDISPDAKVFTFHLRPGVRFQPSGNPMTSADAKWSLERAMNIKGNPSFLLDGIVGVDAPDPLTLVITKSAPDPAFISKSTFGVFAVLDSRTVQAHGGTNASNAATADTAEQWLNQNSAGTGPFVLTKWTPESEIDLVKSNGYWAGEPSFDRVIYRNITTAASAKLTLQAGDIDLATAVSPDSVADLQADPQIKVVQGVGTDVFFLLMNENPDLAGGVMANPQVQQAVRYALDYAGIN